jgi:hypothetical protein
MRYAWGKNSTSFTTSRSRPANLYKCKTALSSASEFSAIRGIAITSAMPRKAELIISSRETAAKPTIS